MIDWRLADRVANAVASTGRTAPGPEGPDVAGEVEAFAARSAELVSQYTGLAAPGALPAPETVDRSGWAQINLGSMRTVLEPVLARQAAGLGPLKVVAGMLLAVEVGALSGFLAARVLGQYEFPVTDPDAPARLLFVGPNLAAAARSLDADGQALTRWVALHETTHALQFAGVPWLRSHMAARIGELIGSLDVKIDFRGAFKLPRLDDLRGLAERVREDGLVTLMAGPERQALIDELQATMALLEGYAEHVMDATGEALLPDLPRLRDGLERRRKGKSGLVRIVERLIGMDLKLRQYEQGKAFCDAVVAAGGIDALNRAWGSPEALPTLAELDAPETWMARTDTNNRS